MRLKIKTKPKLSASLRFALWPKKVWADLKRERSVWIFWETYVYSYHYRENGWGINQWMDGAAYLAELFEASDDPQD